MNKAVGILFFLGIVAVKGAGIGFEAPEYQNQAPPGAMLGWSVIGEEGGKVTDEQSAAGNQSLALESGENLSRPLDESGDVFFLEIAVLPRYEEQASPVINLGGARLGFRKIEGRGQVVAFSNETPVEINKKAFTISPEDDLGEDWVRITVRIDRGQDKWDLYLDNSPMLADLSLISGIKIIRLDGPQEGLVYYDELWQGSQNPLFEDSDKDGMPDAAERAHGLNPYTDDRMADIDADGIRNVDEVFNYGNPLSEETASSSMFVDNLNGSDANTGRLSYGEMSGPKATISAAVIAADEGDVIFIMKGKGKYSTEVLGEPDKNLTIKPIEELTIELKAEKP